MENFKIKNKKLRGELIEARNLCPWLNSKLDIVNFNLSPIHDLCMIWPLPVPEKIGKKGIIEIPAHLREQFRKSFGVLCAVGPGYTTDKGKFVPTKLSAGALVLYDNSVPWFTSVPDSKGKEHCITFCGELDIKGRFIL